MSSRTSGRFHIFKLRAAFQSPMASSSAVRTQKNGVPYIRVSDMDTPTLEVSQMLRTSPAIAIRFLRSSVQENDLVYALKGKLGEVRTISKEVAGANLTQGTARIAARRCFQRLPSLGYAQFSRGSTSGN